MRFRMGNKSGRRDIATMKGLSGLENIGNTCYLNAIIQCLSKTRPLYDYIDKEKYDREVKSSTTGMTGCLIRAFAEVIKELWEQNGVVAPHDFKAKIEVVAPQFRGSRQQDAQEFLSYLLKGLHEDVNRASTRSLRIDVKRTISDSQKAADDWKSYLRKENSTFVDLFVGQLRSTLKCTVCGNCSVTFEPFWDLSLPIPARTRRDSPRLTQCFDLLTKEEILDGDEKPTCSHCQCRTKCIKSYTIQKFPHILVVHLKRFFPVAGRGSKNRTPVDFPVNDLDLSRYASIGVKSINYNLYSVANHSGTINGGHYVAYCKHLFSGEWYRYDDTKVSSVSIQQVVSKEGYLLFYEQCH